ncbi:hypothetical protein DES32_2589 [Methylovirgula ligni]|uniref:Uncharacterized protein n=1 Tax=Methylovirgula ligni TaxID=569860 RepID=A0A3D9YVI6_9HYPH|nr:hypothetical protein DES32_2589 [Methylovirgula ligni]
MACPSARSRLNGSSLRVPEPLCARFSTFFCWFCSFIRM